MKTWIKPVVVVALLLVVAIGVGSCIANHPYSEGYRDGYKVKFSRKGTFRKSWEGELRPPNSAADKPWEFTVADPKVVDQLNTISGNQFVRLYYSEYQWTTGGYTNYRVTKVELLQE